MSLSSLLRKSHIAKASEMGKGVKRFSNQVLTGCCGAIVGFFQPSKYPMVRSQTASSGHISLDTISHMALNCQAMCGSRLRFL
jgi:hypothetical protein